MSNNLKSGGLIFLLKLISVSEKHFVQKHGTAMASKYAGSYANSAIGLLHIKREI